MTISDTHIQYPRNRFVRGSFQALGKFLLALLTKISISNFDHYPRSGRLIVVANHTGIMETVMLTSMAPRQIEFMGSTDIPHEPQLAFFMNAYKFIPVYRGNVSVQSMRAGLHVLEQEGVLGIFPEGGIWEPAIRKAQSGVAWLSYHGHAPVLPIGFKPTAGALPKALKLQRPELVMKVGNLIPPVEIPPSLLKKEAFRSAAQHIMDTVWSLVPEESLKPYEQIVDEKFELETEVTDRYNQPVNIPPELAVTEGSSFSKILYRTTLINNFRQNLHLDIDPLKNIDQSLPPDEIITASGAILDYLENDNPFYFTYRYGQKEGKRMENSIRQIHQLAKWAARSGFTLKATPIRKYKHANSDEEIVETHPTELDKW